MDQSLLKLQLCSMGTILLHRAETRGYADHGWLKSRHTFSFASYFDPERIHFGALRVLNDDMVAGGMGFGEHPHDNMEIISIPLDGALEHRDSLGNQAVIRQGDVQAMSAGTGVRHSEYNHSPTDPVAFLQIWVIPDKRHVEPRYSQITLNPLDRKNKLQQIVSPDSQAAGVWIHQSAWFHLGNFTTDTETDYQIQKPGNGVYAFVIRGAFEIDGTHLGTRDGAGITEVKAIHLKAITNDSEILLMEVPMI